MKIDITAASAVYTAQEVEGIIAKRLEWHVIIYFGMTALLFMAVPSTLAAPVYENFAAIGTRGWGMLIALTCAIHGGALWWNGRSRIMSRIFRSVALAAYLALSFSFASMFLQATIWWPVILFGITMPAMCYALFSRLVSEIKGIKKGL